MNSNPGRGPKLGPKLGDASDSPTQVLGTRCRGAVAWNVTVWAAIVVVLCMGLGATFGVFIDRYRSGDYDDPPVPYADELASQLELSGDQKAQLKQILDQMREKIALAYKNYGNQLRQELASFREEADEQIFELLSEDQKTIYHELGSGMTEK